MDTLEYYASEKAYPFLASLDGRETLLSITSGVAMAISLDMSKETKGVGQDNVFIHFTRVVDNKIVVEPKKSS